jgi:hypothetical protein
MEEICTRWTAVFTSELWFTKLFLSVHVVRKMKTPKSLSIPKCIVRSYGKLRWISPNTAFLRDYNSGLFKYDTVSVSHSSLMPCDSSYKPASIMTIVPAPDNIVITKQLVEWEMIGEMESLRENPSRYHFVHHKSCVSWSQIELWSRGGDQVTNRLGYSKVIGTYEWSSWRWRIGLTKNQSYITNDSQSASPSWC